MLFSMSRKGNFRANAVMESFFHTRKVERVNWMKYATRQKAAVDLNYGIGAWYIQRRLHSGLGYVSPVEYEKSKNGA